MVRVKMFAGPCLIQGGQDVVLAKQLKDIGVDVFRSKPYREEGTHKPTVSRGTVDYYSIFNAIKQWLPIAIELDEIRQLDVMLYKNAEYIWVPARQMQNYPLLKAIKEKRAKGVILKRGMGNTIDEGVGALEYLEGIEDLWVCDRGIVTFDRTPQSRWMPDFKGMLQLINLGHKVIFDASHSTGDAKLIPDLVKAAVTMGVHGIMVECRTYIEQAWSDKDQHLTVQEIAELIQWIKEHES